MQEYDIGVSSSGIMFIPSSLKVVCRFERWTTGTCTLLRGCWPL